MSQAVLQRGLCRQVTASMRLHSPVENLRRQCLCLVVASGATMNRGYLDRQDEGVRGWIT